MQKNGLVWVNTMKSDTILLTIERLKRATTPIAIATVLSGSLTALPASANVRLQLDPRLAEAEISPMDLNRAKNYARQAAEQANGGLGEYRAEPAMHGPSADAPYEINADGTITFTFLGRAPESQTYTVESVVTVDPGNWAIDLEYNGPIRE
ncbi:hypothetical protein CKA32_004850 [Geitlerinema sp. FC II]|nr:hypothetical protein CKA32_004850 [Geitlerinema sp. FC II]